MSKNIIEPLSFLRSLISFPTVSHQSTEDITTFLCSHAEDLDLSVDVYPSNPQKSNIIAHIGPREGSLALSGHMDVVPVQGQNWSRDPFKMHIEGDKIYGRGSCDMKGFFACAYTAISNIPRKKLKRGITLIWTHDEEVGCIGAQQLCHTLKQKQISIPHSILIGEPTSLHIARMHGGHSTLLLKIKGAPAHSSKPILGISAIENAMKAIHCILDVQRVFQQNPCPHHEMKGAHSLINIAKIEGGEAVNIIPEHCSILLGIRPMPGHSFEKIYESIQAAIKKADLSAQYEWELIQNAPPLLSPQNTALETLIANTIPESKSIGLPFATDGGCFAEMGAAPIICGPGSINQAHKADEFISRKELFSYTKHLHSMISKWCL